MLLVLAAVLAAFIPIRDSAIAPSPLHDLEHDLHALVAFCILPLVALANAGIIFVDFDASQFLHSVPLGIAAGLFIVKQTGELLFFWIGVKSGIASLPTDVTWSMVWPCCVACVSR